MLILRGPLAHTHFRIERLLAKIIQIVPQVVGLNTEYIHFIDHEALPMTEHERGVLSELLNYGPTAESLHLEEYRYNLILVVPRMGTCSSWSIKATEIAHYCGLTRIKRIERGLAFYIEANDKITYGDIKAITEFLYDPLTESVLYDLKEADYLFHHTNPKPLKEIDILQGGEKALLEGIEALDLALPETPLDTLLQTFQNLNKNPTDVELMTFVRLNLLQEQQKFLNMPWIIDGILKSHSLLSLIKNTYLKNSRGIISSYQNEAVIIEGGIDHFLYSDLENHFYHYHQEFMENVLEAKSQYQAIRVSPSSVAASSVGSEIFIEIVSGRGAQSKASFMGMNIANLSLNNFALEATVETFQSNACYNNEFGRPHICGYFRTFEEKEPFFREHTSTAIMRGYLKPFVVNGGIGNIPLLQTPPELKKDMVLLILGGPAMLTDIKNKKEERENFEILPQGNPEMARRVQEVINSCWQQGLDNPIAYLHEITTGGFGNTLVLLLKKHNKGARLELRDIPIADSALSPREIWCSESQERVIIASYPSKLENLRKIALREACPLAIIGEITEDKELVVSDRLMNNFPFKMPINNLFIQSLHQRRETERVPIVTVPLDLETIEIEDALFRLLQHPAIADKSALITISDRSVTGLVARDPMVGPWQVPVADCGVIARSFEGYLGEALAFGERPRIALINAKASARMAVGEAITNIAAASIGALSDVRLTLNWLVENEIGEDAKLYDALEAIALDLCPALGITLVLGKDFSFLSNKPEKTEKGRKQAGVGMSMIITALAPTIDVRHTRTPFLEKNIKETTLLFIDLSSGNQRLGGSALTEVYNKLGAETPDVTNTHLLKSYFSIIQQLSMEGKILAYHDRSEGGLLITLCEMAFASHVGLQIDISELGIEPKAILFNEELGAVIQVLNEDVEAILAQFDEDHIPCFIIGNLTKDDKITVVYDEKMLLSEPRVVLQKKWSEMNFLLQSLRDNPRCAKTQHEILKDAEDPGLNEHRAFKIEKEISASPIHGNNKPLVAILREQGTSGHIEMAAAFEKVGFTAVDVHMNDLQKGNVSLKAFKGLVPCGGFSYGDVLGAGQGWAKRILFNPILKDQFEEFFHDESTFTLGVCNGAQMLSNLKTLIPGAELWPSFRQNYSEQFECRLCLVEVQNSPSILLHNMVGSRLLVPVAHGEGRAHFSKEESQEDCLKQSLITLRYVDNYGRKTKIYPANPSGTPLGIAALTNLDGRVNIMMPQPERGFMAFQYSWHPKNWTEEAPWLELFRNARLFV